MEGGGRYVLWENHDACAQQMLATLAVIEAQQLSSRAAALTERLVSVTACTASNSRLAWRRAGLHLLDGKGSALLGAAADLAAPGNARAPCVVALPPVVCS
ncbi:hypothetical protein [Streptomyces sp. NPDC059787]|uniref:hypothetical protein n=1 Tax=Streptomyces sp. NPDC059787 TaxID=3346947 RepID=UPI003658A1CC